MGIGWGSDADRMRRGRRFPRMDGPTRYLPLAETGDQAFSIYWKAFARILPRGRKANVRSKTTGCCFSFGREHVHLGGSVFLSPPLFWCPLHTTHRLSGRRAKSSRSWRAKRSKSGDGQSEVQTEQQGQERAWTRATPTTPRAARRVFASGQV